MDILPFPSTPFNYFSRLYLELLNRRSVTFRSIYHNFYTPYPFLFRCIANDRALLVLHTPSDIFPFRKPIFAFFYPYAYRNFVKFPFAPISFRRIGFLFLGLGKRPRFVRNHRFSYPPFKRFFVASLQPFSPNSLLAVLFVHWLNFSRFC